MNLLEHITQSAYKFDLNLPTPTAADSTLLEIFEGRRDRLIRQLGPVASLRVQKNADEIAKYSDLVSDLTATMILIYTLRRRNNTIEY